MVRSVLRLAPALLLAALAVTSPARADAPSGRIFNGTRTSIAATPWQVLVYSGTISGNTGSLSLCGGSILSSTQILTAAHCASDVAAAGKVGADPNGAGGLGIAAGISDFKHSTALNWFYRGGSTPAAGDAEQDRTVTSVRIHPSWANAQRAGDFPTGDLALLTLGTPLDLSGADARAVALAPAMTPSADDVYAGRAARVTGFGQQAVGVSANGLLYTEQLQIAGRDGCGDGIASAINLCGVVGDGTTCHGDSGSGLVILDPSPVLVGVVSAGPDPCTNGNPTFFASVTPPENALFLGGASSVPTAPRQRSQVSMSAPSTPLPGGTLSCSGGTFTTGTVTWKFTDDAGTVLATKTGASAAYTLRQEDTGHTVGCRAYAVGSGGTAISGMAALNGPVGGLSSGGAGGSGSGSGSSTTPPPPGGPVAAGPTVTGVTPNVAVPSTVAAGSPALTLEAPASLRRGRRGQIEVGVSGLPLDARSITASAPRAGRSLRGSGSRAVSTIVPTAGQSTAKLWVTVEAPRRAKRGVQRVTVSVMIPRSTGPTVVLTATAGIRVR